MSDIVFDARLHSDRLQKDIDQINTKLKRFSRNTQQEGRRVEKSFDGIGRSLKNMIPIASFATIGLMLKQIAASAYRFSNDFSMAMREVQTISQAVAEDFEGISDQIMDMAANSPDDAIKLANAYYQIVSAGYDGAEGLELLAVSSKAATAGLTETQTAADGITTILNAWGKDAKEAERVSDILFKTVEKGKVTFPELAANIAQVAPTASAMGVSFEEITAAIATLTKQGNTAPIALTQLRAALLSMNDVLGDGWSKSMNLQDGLQKIRDMAGGSDTKLQEMMGRVEGMNAVLSLTGEKARGAASDLEAMTTATGSMRTAYDRMMQEADNKWSIVHNKWRRELKNIGDLLSTGSIDIAQKLDELLTNREEDIINPEVSQAVNHFSSELDALGDREGKIALIIEKMQELKNETLKLKKEEDKLEDEAPSYWEKGHEKIWGAFGLRMRGRENEIDTRLVRDDIEINEKVQQELAKIYQEVLSGKSVEVDVEEGKEDRKKDFKTLADAMEEIKKLKDKIGTGTIEQDVQLYLKIANEQEFIDRTFREVRERLKEALNDNIEIEPVSSISAKKIIDEKEVKQQLKPMKTLTAEEEKRLKILNAQYNKLHDQQELYSEIGEGFENAEKILGALSYAVGELDSDLGRALGSMADLAFNAKNLIANISNKNIVGAVASGIGALGNIFGMFNQKGANEVETSLERINRTLEEQSAILANLSGENYFELANKQVEEHEKAIDNLTQKLRYFLSSVHYGENFYGWEVDDFIEAYAKGTLEFGSVGANLLSQIMDEQAAINRFLADTWDSVTATTRDSIADSIMDGFRNGYDSAADFAENFEDLMKNAILNSLKTQLIEGPLTEWYKGFYDAAKDGLTQEEIEEQERFWKNMIEGQRNAYESMEQITGMDLDYSDAGKPEGLTGAIKGITEETAGLIAGQFFAFRELQSKTFFTATEQLDGINQSVIHLAEIAQNTRHNAKLNDIDEKMAELNGYLKDAL